MQIIPQEQVIKRFQLLPDALKDAIFSVRTVDAILKHCALRSVAEDQIHLVGALTSDVLLGYLPPENFSTEIQKETGMEREKALQIAHDLDREIFSEVRLELKKLYPPTFHTPAVSSSPSHPVSPPLTGIHTQKPHYVVPIPERFLQKEVSTEMNVIEHPPVVIEKMTPSLVNEEIAPVLKHPAASTSTIPPSGTPIEPIIPLPTFIQSIPLSPKEDEKK